MQQLTLPEGGEGQRRKISLGLIHEWGDGLLPAVLPGVSQQVTGTVAAVNEDLMDEPQQINQAPYEAWIAKISDVTDTEELLTAAEYADFCEKAKG